MQKIITHEDGSFIGVSRLPEGGAKLSIIDYDAESDLPIPHPMSEHYLHLSKEQKDKLIEALKSA